MPEEHHNYQMKAYAAKKVLNFLSKTCSCGANEIILGVTNFDLYIPHSDLSGYLFGLAWKAGKVAVISTHRLHSQLPEKAHGPLLVERMTKEAMHELGHLSGLLHCHNTTCVMSVSRTAQAIDEKRSEYCLRCREHAAFRADDYSVLSWI
ncbi:hypothetical protein ACFLW4_01595 [Chloroflexota bacterium]